MFFLSFAQDQLNRRQKASCSFFTQLCLKCVFENYLLFPVPLKAAALRFVVLNFVCIAIHAMEII